MIERCGCSSAWASVRRPWRRSSSTSEWSLVSRLRSPSRNTYARLSPTWAKLTSSSPINAAVSVVPIPEREASCSASLWILSLAALTTRDRKCSGASSPSSADSKASAAIREATSPAWAPPIPSATANTGASAK